ncbi:glutamate-ammonia-ligase adenylyltransferase [Friedmanniella endophytica]|uniref:Bifunctional glutamine synthetase adenylyltransferase/adenylyl-removing enzyme n=1 Tax=Microlunatus kandeliicorticis TaxID=1759536 RepID=A0A7W3ISJ2_9ACTN|nr:bifunctional [glutamine synthetase] adenylyltransferase/[glutamine synthetase]-adenylyl-L-tyrosine phosphorylase [Microlunatus kandeliicorticis]MBA8794435.1 glutamate-ammonia-ligase adenylyltransferase [Microlunatus kandeliicorticis]
MTRGDQLSTGALARRGFTDASAAERVLRGWDTDVEPLLDALARSADPDLALAGLDRLRDVRPDLLDVLRSNPVLAEQLIMVAGASAALQHHLVAHPDHLDQLAVRAERRPAAALRAELLTAVGADPDRPDPVAADDPQGADALRLAYRAALLRVAARDVCDPEPIEVLESVAAELSDLADATLETALALARRKVGLEQAAECRLAVIGLGKCGAQELNYVSDVDVLFVAEPALGPDGEPLVGTDRAMTVATRLAAELSRICSAHTAAGTIWEVDAGLRPEGKAGPLVRTLASHQTYYQQWAKTWEFQAMLKARPAAGDLALGRAFVDVVDPLVWQVAETPHFIADAQAMRRRVVAHIPARDAGREIKLGDGGLRDVEFSVQLLQLVHGRADERLRVASTLGGLRALVDSGYVGREDGKGFGLAYRFLRSLEHRIQLFRLRRTHVLPTAEDELRRLGRSLGYPDPVVGLTNTWRSCSQRVRRLHQRLFYSPLLDAVARIPTEELRLTAESAKDRLRALGYDDPDGALRHIEALSTGVSRQAEIQRQLLPVMLGWFAEGANPDHGLLSFRRVSEALGTTPWYLRALRDEGAMAERLARILASSRYAVALLTRAPQSVQMLVDDGELDLDRVGDLRAEMAAAARRQSTPEGAIEAVRAIRRRELFRIAASDLVGLSDVPTVGRALSRLASVTIDAALVIARAGAKTQPAPELAVIAMGRWGGRELSYASDADAMFVMADQPPAHDGPLPHGWDATRIGTGVINRMRELLSRPGADPALAVDANLRPEGKGGALVRSLGAYRNYYARWSSTWELQALIRADAQAGDLGLGASLMETIEAKRWPEGGLSTGQLVEIRRLKARMDAERMPRGADPSKHVKLGPGGLVDVEWTVQLLQLQHAHAHPELRTTGTLDAIDALRSASLITGEDAVCLREAWLLASRIRNLIMLLRGRGSDSLPADARDLEGLARLLDYGPSGSSHLVNDYRRVTRRASQVVDRLFWGE